MHLSQAIFLAIVQGLTEFLPVSSSGHLVLFQKLFNISEPPVFFDVLLHLGTLCAVVIFFRKEIIFLFKDLKTKFKIWVLLIIGSAPAGLLGLVLNSRIDKIFNSFNLLGLMWIFSGILLFFSGKLNKSEKIGKLDEIKKSDALVVGLFQAVALFPGISRSGSTIAGGLIKGFSLKIAFLFSFLLSIPAILGAMVLQIKDGQMSEVSLTLSIVSFVLAGLVGYFSLQFLQKVIEKGKLHRFGLYCLVLGITVLIFFNV